MAKEEKKVIVKNKLCGGGSGAVYGLGMIGALIYYLQNSSTFVEGLLGILKAIFWPAFLIHRVLQILGI